MRPYLVVLLGDDESQRRAEYLRDNRSHVVPDADGERDHLSKPELENNQNAHVALGFVFSHRKNIDAKSEGGGGGRGYMMSCTINL